MRINDYVKTKTQEAQFVVDSTGICMPEVTKFYTRRVVDHGVHAIKNGQIAGHNQKVKDNDEDLGKKIMRSVPVPLENGNSLKMDLTYDQVRIANPEFALKRLEDKRNRGIGMVKAADSEVSFFGLRRTKT